MGMRFYNTALIILPQFGWRNRCLDVMAYAFITMTTIQFNSPNLLEKNILHTQGPKYYKMNATLKEPRFILI